MTTDTIPGFDDDDGDDEELRRFLTDHSMTVYMGPGDSPRKGVMYTFVGPAIDEEDFTDFDLSSITYPVCLCGHTMKVHEQSAICLGTSKNNPYNYCGCPAFRLDKSQPGKRVEWND